MRVLDEVGERALERRPVAAHANRPRRTSLHGGIRLLGRLSEQIEPDFADRSVGSLLTREDEQVVRQPGETLGIALQLLHELRRLTVPPQIRHVAAQRGERGAQLVRGVGEEAPFRVARVLEAGEHRVQRRPQPPHLVRGLVLG